MITKEMLKRCQNELKQAFCALPEDVQKAILDNVQYARCLQNDNGDWGESVHSRSEITSYSAYPWRLSPDTPTESEYDELDVTTDEYGMYRVDVPLYANGLFVHCCVGCSRFIGILYRAQNGLETWRTSVDAAFGTPIKVRFSK